MSACQSYESLGASAKRILDVAEKLGAERGLEAVSVRDVAKNAGISISVIYHHFGSKGGMLCCVLRRRLEELHALRRDLFGEFNPDSPPSLEQLLKTIMAPAMLMRKRSSGGEMAVQFLAHALLSRLPEIQTEIERSVGDLRGLVNLMQEAVPNLSREEICWRLHFTIGVSRMTQQDSQRLAIMSEGCCDAADVDKVIAKAVSYAKAAFMAP